MMQKRVRIFTIERDLQNVSGLNPGIGVLQSRNPGIAKWSGIAIPSLTPSYESTELWTIGPTDPRNVGIPPCLKYLSL